MSSRNSDILELARTDRRSLIDFPRLQAGVQAGGFDAVVASSSPNVTYTGGSFIDFPPLITFVVTTAGGRQGLVINEGDAAYFREYSWIEDIRSFRYRTSTVESNLEAVRMVADLLRELGATAVLGIEGAHLPTLYLDALQRELPTATFSDAGDAFEAVRVIKTKAEIDLLSYAARATDKAIHTGFALVRPGDTEQQLAAIIQGAAVRLGADGLDHADVHAGAHATVVHAWPMGIALGVGDVIHVDFGAVFGGYRTDIARNATVHAATSRQRDFYRPLWVARQRMLEEMKPGATAGEVFQIGQTAIESEGLEYPWGTLGHSIGLSIHEGFEIVRGSERVLEENMVLNIEPSHIEPGHGRYHLEDAVCITNNGARLLSDYSPTEEPAVIH